MNTNRRGVLMGMGAAGVALAAGEARGPSPQRELAGKVAIVTGARNNLGRAFAVGLAKNGANVVVHYHREETKAEAEETAKRVRAHGVKAALISGVTVNTVAPGAVDTPFFHSQETLQSVEYVKNAHVAGRLATVDDIVGTIEFLASPRAAWISAQTHFVNNAYLPR